MILLEICGCAGRLIHGHNENAISFGAQIERRGDAWPVRNFLDG
jgi:hypothetical protein